MAAVVGVGGPVHCWGEWSGITGFTHNNQRHWASEAGKPQPVDDTSKPFQGPAHHLHVLRDFQSR